MRLPEMYTCIRFLLSALRSQWSSAASLSRHQSTKLQNQLLFASQKVPYYQRAYRDIDIQAVDLSKLPILRRETIQRNPDDFLATTGSRHAWKESHTSGSMGKPLVTYFDPNCWWQTKYALKARWLINSGFRPWHRVVIVDDVDTDQLDTHTKELSLWGEPFFIKRQYISVFQSPEAHLSIYEKTKPHFIYGFPSYFLELAHCWDDHSRTKIPLKALISSGETLNPKNRLAIEKAFGVPVIDIYGSTELKDIAWRCPQGNSYHINMESVFVEILDKNGNPTKAGEPGEVVVTSLTNRAMPLIRYATEDIAVKTSTPCDCGRGLASLAYIEGRIAEYLPIPGIAAVSPYQLTTTLSHFKDISQFKITLVKGESLEVQVVLKEDTHEHTLKDITYQIETKIEQTLPVRVHSVSHIERNASGKHRPFEFKNCEVN